MWQTPIDALPDISDTQVIVYTTWQGRSPDLVEDQITYPIVTALLSAPNVAVVRGFSDFGYSYVYILFKRRHGHLLGPVAHPRTVGPTLWTHAGRGHPAARSRRNGRGLGLSVCPGR